MSFDPKGFFKHTRTLEYDSYCQGIEDVMDLLAGEEELSGHFRSQLLDLIVGAADEIH